MIMSIPIIIREINKNEEAFAATVQFNTHGVPHEVTVSNPFSEEEEARLEWYFEQWLNFPFTDKVQAKDAASSIRLYGEALFEQVFQRNPDVYLEYQGLRQEEFLLEIIGSPEFHALHWEALQDPHQMRPLAVDRPVVRKNRQPITYRAEIQPAPPLRVLLVTARPSGLRDVSYRTISRPLVEALETGQVAAQIDIVRPGTFKALVNHLEDVRDEQGDGYYHIIHLDMHGALLTYDQYRLSQAHQPSQYSFGHSGYTQTEIKEYEGVQAFLFFEEAEGGSNPVSADDVARLLNMHQIPIVVLSSCQSGKQVGAEETSLGSRLISVGVQLVVATAYSITVTAMRLLTTTFYRQLLAGHEPVIAIRRARLELYNDKRRQAAFRQEITLEDWLLPVIYQNHAPRFELIDSRDVVAVLPVVYTPPRITYQFVGRDIDILQVERHLLHQRNLLLVRGMGGVGKTTLLHHLGWWWQKTRFVAQVFYFGYDFKAYTLPEIVSAIGRQLGLNLSGIAAPDRAQVIRTLKSSRHLLILDNLESITGERLAVQHTLMPEAQAELRDFLQELVGGQSLVLLGSRGSEEWLRPDPLRDSDVYELPGLDYEAQTVLAQAILQAVGAPYYPEQAEHQADFRRLLKLLNGHPLAIEVVLPNLAQFTPSEIISRLQAGDVDLDASRSMSDKTQSIVRSIEYSHSNLSDDAQKLLLCLAPFTGVINTTWLSQYAEHLQSFDSLVNLPYDKWLSILQEAINWGLVVPHEQFGDAGYLRLQPILTYFLKMKLNTERSQERNKAIQAAFSEHYIGIGSELTKLIESTEAQEKQLALALINIEYENLITALQFNLDRHKTITTLYLPLANYLDTTQNQQKGLELGLLVLEGLKAYPGNALSGSNGLQYIGVMDDIGGRLLRLRSYDKAQEVFSEALQLVDKLSDIKDQQKAMLLSSLFHNLGIIAQEQRQWAAAEGYYKEALQIQIDFNDRYGLSSTLHQLGFVAQEQRQWAAAEGYYKEALQIQIDFNDRYSQALTLQQLGKIAAQQRQWAAAEGYYKEALQIQIDFNDRYGLSSTLHQLGLVAQEQRQWAAAEGYYKEALQIKIEYSDRHSQAGILHQLGRIAAQQRQWAAAEGYYKEALQIQIDFNDRYSQARTLLNLGNIAQEQRQWTTAESYYKEALQIQIDFSDRYEKSYTLHNLGSVAQAQQRWAEAESYYKEALQIKMDFNDRYEQASTFHQLGSVAQQQRKWGEAQEYYGQAAQIYASYGDTHAQAGSLHQIGRIAEEQGQLTEAAERYFEVLPIYLDFDDNALAVVVRSLARVWRDSQDESIPTRLANTLGTSSVEVMDLFERAVALRT